MISRFNQKFGLRSLWIDQELARCYDNIENYPICQFFFTQGEAVQLIADGKAPRIVQPEEGATYDKIWKKKEVAQVILQNGIWFA